MGRYQRLLPYSLAVGATAAAGFLSLGLAAINDRTIGAFFYIAIAGSTRYGGRRPGILAIVLSVLALNYYFIPPIYKIQIADSKDVLRLVLFTTVALIINLLTADLQESKQKVERLNRQITEESASRLQVALDAAQMGMWDWNIVTGEIQWSPQHEQLFGLAPGTFDGRYETFDARLHPADREGLNQAVAYALQNCVPYRHEYRVVWPEGSVHWVEGRGQAFYGPKGQPVRMSGTIIAIDERKQAETSILALNQELQQRVTELQTLLDVIPIGIGIAKDRDCRHIHINPAFAQTLNVPSTANASLSALDKERPTAFKLYQNGREMAPEELPLQYAAAHGVEVRDLEVDVVWQDGTTITLLEYAAPLFDEQGQPWGSVGAFLDITERKRAEAAFRQQQELLQTILDHIPIMVAVFDAETQLRWVNREWERFTGWTLADAKSRNLLEAFYPDPQYRQCVLDYIQAADQTWGDFKTRLRDGSVAETSWANVRLSDGSSIGIGRDVTHERQLERERARLVAILENSPDFVGIADTTGRALWLNSAAKRLIGCAPNADSSQFTITDLHPAWASELIQQQGLAVASRHGSWRAETALRHQDGSEIAVSQVIIAHQAADGSVTYFSTIMQDIRERKQAEEAVRLSEERYRSLVEATTNSVWLTDARGNVLQTASIWTHVTGQVLDQTSGWDYLQAIHPSDRNRVAQAFRHCLATGEQYEIEFRVLSQTGPCCWLLAKAAPVYNRDGSIREWIGTFNDITERRAAEAALRESEERLRTVLQNMPVMLDAFDEQGNIIVWNQECERVTGYLAEEMIQSPTALERLYPDPAYRQQMMIRWGSEGNHYRNWEWDLVSKSGETKIVSWSNLSDDYPVPGWATWGVGVDITERKLAEYALEELNATLEKQVEERTAALTLANQELEAFSYSVSHDLRAPLRGIDGFSKALLERYVDQLDDKGKHYLARIRSGTQRMGELIDDMLKLSRVARADMRRSSVDLSQIAAEIAAGLSETQPGRLVEWAIAPEVTALGDKGLLRIVLENLLGNAWKFTSTREQAAIAFGVTTQPNGTQAYFVKDNGVGFDMAYVNKLFQAFQRLHSEQEFPGTGIGLAIVQRIVHRHGGAVWAEGTLQQGATVYFTLEAHCASLGTER